MAYYIKWTFKMLIAVIEGENADMVMEFGKRFNVSMAIATIIEACSDTRVLHYCGEIFSLIWFVVLKYLILQKKIFF